MKAPGSSDVLVDELFATTTRLRTYVDARLREHGASVARLRAMRMLAAAGEPLRMRDLGEMLGIAARTTTDVVDALERDGLVERVRHPRTAGRTWSPSPTRRRCHLAAEAVDRDALATATGALSAPERAELRTLLALIRDGITEQEG